MIDTATRAEDANEARHECHTESNQERKMRLAREQKAHTAPYPRRVCYIGTQGALFAYDHGPNSEEETAETLRTFTRQDHPAHAVLPGIGEQPQVAGDLFVLYTPPPEDGEAEGLAYDTSTHNLVCDLHDDSQTAALLRRHLWEMHHGGVYVEGVAA